MPDLARPTVLVRDSFVEAACGFRDEGWLPDFPVEEVAADFGGYVQRVLAEGHDRGVPVTTLWYTDGATYLGTVIVRHQLTPGLTRRGGHIGYQVAPRHRRQRHATAMLAAALAYCRDTLGLARVLITCDEPNTASRRVIEGNSGTLENTLDGECRYWDQSDGKPAAGCVMASASCRNGVRQHDWRPQRTPFGVGRGVFPASRRREYVECHSGRPEREQKPSRR